MKHAFVGGWVVLLLVTLGGCARQLERHEFTHPQMGTRFRLVLYAPDQAAASRAAGVAFDRIDQINAALSDYLPGSELNRLAATAGTGYRFPASRDLWTVLSKAQEVSRRSGGAFDVTVGPVIRLWRQARRARRLPEEKRLEKARMAVGFRHIHLDPMTHTVTLDAPDMRLDLGGIAKGYAGAEALAAMKQLGVDRALIECGGNPVLGDPPPDRDTWTIALMPLPGRKPAESGEDPANSSGGAPIYVRLKNIASSTSGDAFQHVDIGGVRYSHIIDPRTGMALTNGVAATVICPDAALADALSTACCVMAPDKAMKLIESYPDTAAMIVRNVDGKIETYFSPHFPAHSDKP
ncbi:FAD:protein FMN transferase [Planctomycetales bacterium ZRK34]|nr:FAD:protein FMN transferase [Planctomycetales bacterium ZRK34]